MDGIFLFWSFLLTSYIFFILILLYIKSYYNIWTNNFPIVCNIFSNIRASDGSLGKTTVRRRPSHEFLHSYKLLIIIDKIKISISHVDEQEI